MTAATILHEAEVELWEAVAYYESRSSGLGLDFEVEIEASVHSITQSPDRFHVSRSHASGIPFMNSPFPAGVQVAVLVSFMSSSTRGPTQPRFQVCSTPRSFR